MRWRTVLIVLVTILLLCTMAALGVAGAMASRDGWFEALEGLPFDSDKVQTTGPAVDHAFPVSGTLTVSVGIDQGDHHDRNAEQRGRQPGQAVEGLVRGGVQDPVPVKRRQPCPLGVLRAGRSGSMGGAVGLELHCQCSGPVPRDPVGRQAASLHGGC